MLLDTNVDYDQEAYKANYEALLKQVLAYEEVLDKVKKQSNLKAKQRVLGQGKLLVNDRINQLIDAGSYFFELSAIAGLDVYEHDTAGGGIVTGIGLVQGVPCMIMANDPTVKGGAYFPITLKKQLRAQAIAEKLHLPCIYLVDSAGAFLPMQDEVFPDQMHFGRLFYNEANMSSKSIPQIAVVLGLCTAGGAYIPAMADISVMVNKQATIFLGGPPLVKAATGEEISAEELGGAKVHCQQSGVADYMADNEQHALNITRDIVSQLNLKPLPAKSKCAFEQPLYPMDDLLGIIPASNKHTFDIREVIARLIDGSHFNEFKALFGITTVCGFAKIEGHPVGIIANNGILFSESAQKAAHFIQLCEKRHIPLLFLQNISGFMVGKDYEQNGIAKHGAKLVNAVACAKVPKLTVVVGGSFGAGNYAMCGRAYDPLFMWMWPNAKVGVMGGEQAANVLTQVKADALHKKGQQMPDDVIQAMKSKIQAQYDKQSHAYYASARCWDDGIIDPRDTRKYLAMALDLCANQYQKEAESYGVFRM